MSKDFGIQENDIAEVLFKSNTLIKSNISITSVEYKIFNRILYKCQIDKVNRNQLMAELTLHELNEIVLNKKENTLNALTQTLEKFIKTPIKFEKKKSYVITSLINKVVVDKKNFTFYCYLDKDLYEVLMGYRELGYSPINLKMMKKANGYYTQRFYELFRIWSGCNKDVTYDIDKLKNWLMIKEGTAYDRYYNFKVKVIQPALKEINNKLNMKVEYKENKTGRSVRSITFMIEDLEPRKYSFNSEDIIMSEAAVDSIDAEYIETDNKVLIYNYKKLLEDNKIKIASSTLDKLKDKYGESTLNSAVEILCRRRKEVKISAPVRYLKGILENINSESSSQNKFSDSTKLKFNNFEGREYDYDELERKLLGWE